jgi:20S proteasome alpha/beta subunit
MLLATSSEGQFEELSSKGTVIVIGHSIHKIVVAADSRATHVNQGATSDDTCKIIALNDHAVFTGAGAAAHVAHGIAYCNAYIEAVRAFKKSKESDTDVLQHTATKWGNHFTDLVNAALKADPEETKW